MKLSPGRRGAAIAIIWALMPWLFAAVYLVHKPGHADPFWLPAMPFAFASFIPMLLSGADTTGFPLKWVILSSLFNLSVGVLLAYFVAWVRSSHTDEKP